MSTYLSVLLSLGVAVLAGGIGFAVAYSMLHQRRGIEFSDQQAEAQRRLAQAESEAKEKLLEAKEEAVRLRTLAEQEARETRAQAQQLERRLLQKEENLERRSDDLGRREQALTEKERVLEDLRGQLEEANRQQLRELERVANMTRHEAQNLLMEQVEQDLQAEVARKVREAELAARDESERRARAIVTEAIQRIAADQTAETSVSVLPLPNEELKG